MRGSYNDLGVIIKTQDYKEADKVITILTATHGLVHYFAIGARRSASKKAAHLDLLSHIKFSANTSNNQSYLMQADSLNFFAEIKNNLKKIGLAMSFLEIIYHLLPAEVEDNETYKSFVIFLDSLNNSKDENSDKVLSRKFGSYLLRHLGYPPPPSSGTNLSNYFETLMNRKIIGKEIG